MKSNFSITAGKTPEGGVRKVVLLQRFLSDKRTGIVRIVFTQPLRRFRG